VNDVAVRLGLLEERRITARLGGGKLPHQLQHLLLVVTDRDAGSRTAELSEWGPHRPAAHKPVRQVIRATATCKAKRGMTGSSSVYRLDARRADSFRKYLPTGEGTSESPPQEYCGFPHTRTVQCGALPAEDAGKVGYDRAEGVAVKMSDGVSLSSGS
jgi:hypothetical protein